MNKFEIEVIDTPSYFDEEIGEECDGLKCPYCDSLVLSYEDSIQPCKHVACYTYSEGVEYVHSEFTLGEELCKDFGSAYKGFTIAVTLYLVGKYSEGKVYHVENIEYDDFIGFFK